MSLKNFTLAALCFTAISVVSTGCAYRTDLAQGNFVEQDAVDSLRYGMTADQVRYVMGTPMLVDPFDNTRWYYVHYLREGWSSPNIKNLVLLFSGNILVDMSGDFKKPATFGSSASPAFQTLPQDAVDVSEEKVPDGSLDKIIEKSQQKQ